jgi:hypothetical protein
MHVYTILRKLHLCALQNNGVTTGASSHAKEAKEAKEATAKEANSNSKRSQQQKKQVKDDGILPPGNNV